MMGGNDAGKSKKEEGIKEAKEGRTLLGNGDVNVFATDALQQTAGRRSKRRRKIRW